MRRTITLALLPLAFSCEPEVPEECTTLALPGVVVRVDNARDEPACDAELVITDGDYVEELGEGSLLDGQCVFQGALERPGDYRLDVTGRGYLDFSADINVGSDACHVITETVDVRLDIDCPEEPNPGLEVIVRDEQNVPLCNLVVTAIDGTYEERLQLLQLGPGNCRFVGVFDRAGTYAIDVDTNPPFEDFVTEPIYRVDEDICGIVQTDIGLSASRPACPPFIAPMFQISLSDAADGAAICNAQVIASEGQFSTTLLPNGCTYEELGDNRAGTYALEITHPDYQPLSLADVVVPLDAQGCTVVTHTASYELTAIQ